MECATHGKLTQIVLQLTVLCMFKQHAQSFTYIAPIILLLLYYCTYCTLTISMLLYYCIQCIVTMAMCILPYYCFTVFYINVLLYSFLSVLHFLVDRPFLGRGVYWTKFVY